MELFPSTLRLKQAEKGKMLPMNRPLILSFMLILTSACSLQQVQITPEPTAVVSIPTTPAASTVVAANPDTTACFFSPYGIGSPFDAYNTPDDDLNQRASVGMVDYGVSYPVVAQNDLWYQIEVSEGVLGWVRWGTGGLSGNCSGVPTTSTRPPAPDGICTVYFDAVTTEDVLYADQNGGDVIAQMVAGEYVAVEARGNSRGFRVRLSDGRTGWLTTPDQLLYFNRALHGACDTLPVEQPNIIGG